MDVRFEKENKKDNWKISGSWKNGYKENIPGFISLAIKITEIEKFEEHCYWKMQLIEKSTVNVKHN